MKNGLLTLVLLSVAGLAEGVHGYRDTEWMLKVGNRVVPWKLPPSTNDWSLQFSPDGCHWQDLGTGMVGNVQFIIPTNSQGFFRLKSVS